MADPFTISFLMKMITDRVDMMLTRGLTLERVTASQGRVLAYLMSRDGENVSQRDIIVQRLEQKGWVTTAFDSEDGRLKNVYLTDMSRGVHEAICQQIGVIENTLLDGVPEESRSMLRDLLRRMYDNLK